MSKQRGMHYRVRWDDAREPLVPKKTMLKVGDVAPVFAAKTLNGTTFNLSETLGRKTIVLVFWASWCKPCLLEAPHLVTLHKKFKDRDVQFVGVSIDESGDRATLANIVKNIGLSYPVLLDSAGEILALYAQGASIPLTFVVAPSRRIVYRHQNFSNGDEVGLENAIRAVLPF